MLVLHYFLYLYAIFRLIIKVTLFYVFINKITKKAFYIFFLSYSWDPLWRGGVLCSLIITNIIG